MVTRDWTIEHTQRLQVEGAELEYEIFGTGEPVLLIHGALLGDSVIGPFQLYSPFMGNYQVISYHRAGYGRSSIPDDVVTIEQSAENCYLLLKEIGVEKVHVVAHSYGGLIALQLAMSFPEVVHSLSLLEAFVPRTEQKALDYFEQAYTKGLEIYNSGDKTGARESILNSLAGPDIMSACDLNLPPGNMEVTTDVDAFFNSDIPAFNSWNFDVTNPDQERRPQMPVLTVLGLHSDAVCPGFREGQAFLSSWLPQAEVLGIPAIPHPLHIASPQVVCKEVFDFLQRHPM